MLKGRAHGAALFSCLLDFVAGARKRIWIIAAKRCANGGKSRREISQLGAPGATVAPKTHFFRGQEERTITHCGRVFHKPYQSSSRKVAKTPRKKSSSFTALREPPISLSVVHGPNAGAKRMEDCHEPSIAERSERRQEALAFSSLLFFSASRR